MLTPKQIRRFIAQYESAIAKLRKKADFFEVQIAKLRDLLSTLEAAGTEEALHKRLHSSTVNEPSMEKSHRLAISEGHKGDADPFLKAIRAKGFSQNSLAKRVGINQAVLSLHRRELRKIPQARAKRIEALTGWPADAKHWPVGIISDGE